MKLLDSLIKILPTSPVYAHCDLPCGIYDPHAAQLAAHTVIRMTKFAQDLHKEPASADSSAKATESKEASAGKEGEEAKKKFIHDLARVTKVKEEHAELCKREITTLWGDYFKPEHLEKFPELHDLVWKTLKLASKCKQNIDPDAAQELLTNTQKIAEIFWKTKDKEPVRVPSGYPTEGEMVTHK